MSTLARPAAAADWHEANQRYLMAEVRRVLAHLEGRREQAASETEHIFGEMGRAPAIEVVRRTFGLSCFERDVLLLCAGVELDASVREAVRAATGESGRGAPTWSLALAALPEAHWSALSPQGGLRRWRLIEAESGDLTASPLRIDERILHYLAGVQTMDPRLIGLVEAISALPDLASSQRDVARRIGEFWAEARLWREWPLLQLCGPDTMTRRMIAAAAAVASGVQPHLLRAEELPAAPVEREALARLWEREAALLPAALVIEYEGPDLARRLTPFVENLFSPVFLSGREPLGLEKRCSLRFDVRKSTPDEQHMLWQRYLPEHVAAAAELDRVVAHFDFGPVELRSAALQARERLTIPEPQAAARAVWDACRMQARQRLEDLAQRLEPAVEWDDLVLPEAQKSLLRDIAAQVRHRWRVYNDWGFADKCARGLGISALFSGPSGTGKTMAAEVLAAELRLDLYRVDLSQVVSKYIGETEKNLSRVFDAAEAGGVVLLLDECDSLLGKRSEVRDSHDRFANIEISYLLQRMEAYRGLAILTTNMKSAIDNAFLRRIRFIVTFPFPDAAQRAAIWRRMFPPRTPVEGLDFEKLAKLNVAGGSIRNIAMHAAFLAADAGAPVGMKHLLQAARIEYAKLEKPLSEAETGGWL